MSAGNVIFRPVEERDFLELKQLHVECFPIRYEDAFFANAVKGLGVHNSPLFSNIAVDCESNTIVGCILAQFNQVSRNEDKNLFGEPDSGEPASQVMYILTIGLRQECRRTGIGSQLLLSCVEHAKQNPKCGGVYLHVIHYNTAAIRFYERNDFIFFRTLEEFYLINGVTYTAYLYILYVNGHRAPLWHRLLHHARVATQSGLHTIFCWVSAVIPRWTGTVVSSILPQHIRGDAESDKMDLEEAPSISAGTGVTAGSGSGSMNRYKGTAAGGESGGLEAAAPCALAVAQLDSVSVIVAPLAKGDRNYQSSQSEGMDYAQEKAGSASTRDGIGQGNSTNNNGSGNNDSGGASRNKDLLLQRLNIVQHSQ